MRFPRVASSRPRIKAALNPLYSWHVWFAWKIVKVGHQWVWLERVYRKGTERWIQTHDHACPVIHSWHWQYDNLPYIGKL